jgi:serine protease inhibitor
MSMSERNPAIIMQAGLDFIPNAQTRAHLRFALTLHRALAPDPSVAACWSPFSVASALGLVAYGARGATRDELTTLLLDSQVDSGLTDYAGLLADATKLESAVLGVSNTLWKRPEIPVRQEFAEELLVWPHGAIRDAPFSDPEAARQLINADVSEATHGLIPELIGPSTIPATTTAAVVNALYLRAAWLHGFDTSATEPQPFHGSGGEVEVPTMRNTFWLGYAAFSDWQVVVLPPGAGDVDAVLLLPDRDLITAESALDVGTLAALLAAPQRTRVELLLPKFQVRVQSELTNALLGVGVRTMFSNQADFSGISNIPPRKVDKALHEAVLTIDEQGLEGAAATAIVAVEPMVLVAEPNPVTVRVDRPFLLLVRHPRTGVIYFLTRVVRP